MGVKLRLIGSPDEIEELLQELQREHAIDIRSVMGGEEGRPLRVYIEARAKYLTGRRRRGWPGPRRM